MAKQVYVPERQDKPSGIISKVATIGGAIIGGIYGGPQGAAAGAGIGNQVGGMIDGQKAASIGNGPQGVQTQGSAMDRRKQQLDNDPQSQIRSSIDSLQYVQDDQTRAELAKPLMKADYLARNQKKA